MNPSGANGGGLVRLFREYDLEGAEVGGALHGATFDGARLVLAGGRYLLRLVPESGRIVDRFETCPEQGGIGYDGYCLWQRSAGRLERLDTRTGFPVCSIAPLVEGVTGLASLEGDVLVLYAGGRRLARVRVEPHALSTEAVVVGDVESNVPLRGLAWWGGELWSSAEGALVRIDPTTAGVVERLGAPPGPEVRDLAVDFVGRFWCVDGRSAIVRVLARHDPVATGVARGRRPSARRAPVPPSSRVIDISTKLPAAESPTEPARAVAAPTFQRILVPVDFSRASRRALATALALQDLVKSEVHLFHLAEEGANAAFLAGSGASVSSSHLAEETEGRLRRFVDNVFPGRAAGVTVHAHVGADVVRAVGTAARALGPTLVILVGGPRQMLFRTHVERIARALDVAVLVLPRE